MATGQRRTATIDLGPSETNPANQLRILARLEDLSDEQAATAVVMMLGFAARLSDDDVAAAIRPGWTYSGAEALRLSDVGVAAPRELSRERWLAGFLVGTAWLQELTAEQFEKIHAQKMMVRARRVIRSAGRACALGRQMQHQPRITARH